MKTNPAEITGGGGGARAPDGHPLDQPMKSDFWDERACIELHRFICKKDAIFLQHTTMTTTTTTPTSIAAPYKCPDGWSTWTDQCYYYSSTEKMLEDAVIACSGMSAHLASIHSPEENAFVMSSGAASYDHWLGMARNTSREGTLAFKREDWHWLDGTRFDYYYWADSQPNTNVACAMMTKKTGFWEGTECTKRHRFICKKGSVLSTTTKMMTKTTTTMKQATTTESIGSIVTTSQAPHECPEGWIKATNYCYFFSPKFAPLLDAEVECTRMSAHLTSLHSLAENTLVTNSGTQAEKEHSPSNDKTGIGSTGPDSTSTTGPTYSRLPHFSAQ
ncbi:hypothetical protein LSAT2_021365 [Lamellibrachia satsuma]|nr:hypothetical protein LSAT2_021365 [Lamellibrachia satsuma]